MPCITYNEKIWSHWASLAKELWKLHVWTMEYIYIIENQGETFFSQLWWLQLLQDSYSLGGRLVLIFYVPFTEDSTLVQMWWGNSRISSPRKLTQYLLVLRRASEYYISLRGNCKATGEVSQRGRVAKCGTSEIMRFISKFRDSTSLLMDWVCAQHICGRRLWLCRL